MPSDLEIERTSRRLTAAFSPGQPWDRLPTIHDRQPQRDSSDDERIEGTDRLAVVRRSRTIERAGQFVHHEQAFTPEEWAQVEAWGALQTKQDGTRTDRVRELVQWKTLRTKAGAEIAATPSRTMDTTLLGALSFANLDGPLGAWLEVYALERWDRWPTVAMYARACGLEHHATQFAAMRILFPFGPRDRDRRAVELGLRRSVFRRDVRKAESLLWDWLGRAARRLHRSLSDDEIRAAANIPAKGYSNRAPTSHETDMTLHDQDRAQMRELIGLLRAVLLQEPMQRRLPGSLTLPRPFPTPSAVIPLRRAS